MRFWLAALMLALVVAGCSGKREKTHTPPPVYVGASAQQAGVVQIRGDVRNRVIPWSEDLTLAGALVEAEYTGRIDPLSVTVTRGRKVQRFSSFRLLSGGDMFLEPGDIIDIHR